MKKIGFFRLFMRSLPEIWFCQLVIGIILWFPMKALNTLFMDLSTAGDSALTTANFEMFLSRKTPALLVCSFLLVLLLFIGEIFAPIYLCDAIQKQEKTGVFSILKKSIMAIPCFFTPAGFLILVTDFARLTGDPRKPSEMTLDDVMKLKIRDTTGNGELLSVPTLEEMLDHGKGKVKLFLELKGESADYDMADDVIKAVKERDMTDDVVLISLNYDVINYAEHTYPEMETGVLIFGSVGDAAKLNCDMIIMEEEMSVDSTIRKIHDAGKKAGVWTVNTERHMRRFLDSEAGSGYGYYGRYPSGRRSTEGAR